MSVGMPQSLLLQEFGEHIRRAFGHVAYHVGSSLEKKDGWRDVDVRLMLPDEEYAPYGDPEHPQENKKWVSTVLAWSAFGRQLTGLPIDFQIQPITYANAKHGKARSAIFRLSDRCRQASADPYGQRGGRTADVQATEGKRVTTAARLQEKQG